MKTKIGINKINDCFGHKRKLYATMKVIDKHQ